MFYVKYMYIGITSIALTIFITRLQEIKSFSVFVLICACAFLLTMFFVSLLKCSVAQSVLGLTLLHSERPKLHRVWPF